MNCPTCNAPLESDDVFCPDCGAKLDATPVSTSVAPALQKKKPLPTKLIAIVLAAVVVVGGGVATLVYTNGVRKGMYRGFNRVVNTDAAVTQQTDAPVTMPPTTTSPPPTQPPFEYALSSHSFESMDSNGYKLRTTVRIGGWIKGSDTDKLQQAWKSVGGRNAMPLTSGRRDGGGITFNFSQESAAYIFGTVSFANMTPEFPASNFGNGLVMFTLAPRVYNGQTLTFGGWVNYVAPAFGTSVFMVEYSNKTDYIRVRADMQSNNWGPVPFVLAIDNVFNPNYPNGNPELDQVTLHPVPPGSNLENKAWTYDETVISVKKTWLDEGD